LDKKCFSIENVNEGLVIVVHAYNHSYCTLEVKQDALMDEASTGTVSRRPYLKKQ
jgi:hypothetical protein